MAAPSCEERSPEPKPRWNPKPEQIRILEAIFNSGMVNPPREEIRKIRAQLQEFGQVGDANVFYWFQNRKSRNKHKLRHLQSSRQQQQQQRSMAVSSATPTPITTTTTTTTIIAVAPTSSSSSSSDRSSASDKAPPPVSVAALTAAMNVSPSPTPSVNQAYFQGLEELCGEPFFFQVPQGSCYSAAAGDLAAIVTGPEEGLGVCPALWTELIMGQDACKAGEEEARVRMHYGSGVTAAVVAHSDVTANTTTTTVASLAAATGATTTTVGIASPVSEIQGGTGVGATRSIVFINEVAFEVAAVPLNVREAFGDEAVLLNSSGHPVPTDELGLTLQPLQHGASYYLV